MKKTPPILVFDDGDDGFEDNSQWQNSRRLSRRGDDDDDNGVNIEDFKGKLTDHAPMTLERGGQDDDDDDEIESLIESENFRQTSNNNR